MPENTEIRKAEDGSERFLKSADQRIFICFFSLIKIGIVLAVKPLHRADNRLLGEKSGENRNARRPIVALNSDWLKNRCNCLADY